LGENLKLEPLNINTFLVSRSLYEGLDYFFVYFDFFSHMT
jgi:hypothetical protein